MREVFHVPLIAIEQAVEADGRVMMRAAVEWAEAEAGIEAGLAHGAVADVEVLAEAVAIGPGALAHDARVDVAARLFQAIGLRGAGMLSGFDQPASRGGTGMRLEPANHVGIVGAVVG